MAVVLFQNRYMWSGSTQLLACLPSVLMGTLRCSKGPKAILAAPVGDGRSSHLLLDPTDVVQGRKVHASTYRKSKKHQAAIACNCCDAVMPGWSDKVLAAAPTPPAHKHDPSLTFRAARAAPTPPAHNHDPSLTSGAMQGPLGSLASLDGGLGGLRRPPRGPTGPGSTNGVAPARVNRFGAPGTRLPAHSSF